MVFLWYSNWSFWITTGLDKGKFGSATERMYWRFELVSFISIHDSSLLLHMEVLPRYQVMWKVQGSRISRNILFLGHFSVKLFKLSQIVQFHLKTGFAAFFRFFLAYFSVNPPQFFQITLDHWSALTGCTDASNRVNRLNFPICFRSLGLPSPGHTHASNLQHSLKLSKFV